MDSAQDSTRTEDRDTARDSTKTQEGDTAQDSTRTQDRTSVRLSVNLGAQPAAALRELMTKKGITATEAVRRALSIWKFVEDERAQGHRLAVLEGDGDQRAVREIIFHD